MGDLNPILASYLAGYQTRLAGLKEAHSYGIQKQHLDEMAKQFKTEMEFKNKQHDLATQIYQLTRQHDIAEHQKNLFEQLQKDPNSGDAYAPDWSKQTGFPTMGQQQQIMGPDQLPQNTMIPGVQSSIQGSPAGTMLNMPTPYGENLPMLKPRDPGQKAIEEALNLQTALAPGIEKQFKNTIMAKDLQDSAVKLAIAEARNKNLEENYILRLQGVQETNSMRQQISESQNFAKMMTLMLMNGINPNPEAQAQQEAVGVRAAALGRASNNFTQTHGPIMGRNMQKAYEGQGFAKLPDNFREKIDPMAEDALGFINTVETLKQQLGTPHNLVDKLGNVIAEKTGYAGLSPYKSQFDMLQIKELPKMDVALGFTPGTLSRAPKLLDKLKSLLPLEADSKFIVNEKEANGADIYLSGIAKKLSTLPLEHRKLIWQDVIDNNRALFERNSIIANKLIKAKNTGNYESGSLLKEWLGAQP